LKPVDQIHVWLKSEALHEGLCEYVLESRRLRYKLVCEFCVIPTMNKKKVNWLVFRAHKKMYSVCVCVLVQLQLHIKFTLVTVLNDVD